LFGDNSHLTNSDSAFINAYLAGTNSDVSFGYFVFDIDQSRIYYANCTANVWIGANDLQDGVNWRWTDGTPLIYNQWQSGIWRFFTNYVSSKHFDLGFPTSLPSDNCAAMLISGDHVSYWINDKCSTKKSSICAMPQISGQ